MNLLCDEDEHPMGLRFRVGLKLILAESNVGHAAYPTNAVRGV